jgi:hypothetical protein
MKYFIDHQTVAGAVTIVLMASGRRERRMFDQMACRVPGTKRSLTAAFVLTLASLSGHASLGQTQATPCFQRDLAGAPAARQKQVREFQESVEAGPIYKELLLRLGEPEHCGAKVTGENVALSYAFPKGARLDASFNSSIEFSEQHAQFRGLDREKAFALLRQSERDSFGDDGCGIDWNRPETESKTGHSGSQAEVFRGDSCNCQARILYQDNSVVGLALSSSC